MELEKQLSPADTLRLQTSNWPQCCVEMCRSVEYRYEV